MEKESEGVKTARSGMIYVFGQSIGSIAVLATFAVLARMFTTTNWGLYSIVIAFYTFFGMLGNFSIGAAVRKKLVDRKSDDAKKKLITNAYVAALAISLVVAVIAMGLSGYAARSIYKQPSISGPLLLVGGLVVLWALFNVTLSVLVAVGMVKEAAIIDIIYSSVQLIAAPVLVLLGYGVIGAIWGLAIGIISGTLVGLVYLFRKIKKPSMDVEKKEMEEIVGFATPVYISLLVMQGIYSLGILLLGGIVSATIVGNYNIGYELGGFVSIILGTSVFILLPAFSALSSRKKSKDSMSNSLNKSIYYTMLFLVPIVACVVSISTPIVFLLFSHKYIYAPFYFSVVAIGFTIGIIWNYASTMLLGMGAVKKFLKYQLLSAAFELALLFALTPIFKITGMLLGLFLIFPVVMDIVYVIEMKKSIAFVPEIKKPAIIVMCSLIIFALLYSVTILLARGYLSIVTNIIITLALYPPLLALAGGVTKDDIKFLTKTAGERKVSKPLLSIINYTSKFVRE